MSEKKMRREKEFTFWSNHVPFIFWNHVSSRLLLESCFITFTFGIMVHEPSRKKSSRKFTQVHASSRLSSPRKKV